MNNEKKILGVVIGVVLGGMVMTAQAAVLNNGDQLTINAGVSAYDSYGNWIGISSGSWLSLDTNYDSKITNSEKVVLYPGTDGGVVIGETQSPGQIDYWVYGSSTGYEYTTVAPTGSTTSGINFSGWSMTGGTGPSSPMGSGAWAPTNCGSLGCTGVSFANGVAAFSWSGVYGDTYSLWYSATVPVGDPAGFGGVKYLLHLEGVVNAAPAVPVPAAAWLFGSGLLGLMGIARRKAG